HSTDGRLGAKTVEFGSRLPFGIDAKLPTEITANDELHIPVAVANNTDSRRTVRAQVNASGLTRTEGDAEATFGLDAETAARRVFKFKPDRSEGDIRVRLDGRSDLFSDQVERTMKVVPDGFPVLGAASGTMKRDLTAKIDLPDKFTPGTL